MPRPTNKPPMIIRGIEEVILNSKSFFEKKYASIVPSFYQPPTDDKILFIDCGAKTSQLRNLLEHNFVVHVVAPRWNNMPDPYKVYSLGYKGIFISNGPYDPKDWSETRHWLENFLKHNKILCSFLNKER